MGMPEVVKLSDLPIDVKSELMRCPFQWIDSIDGALFGILFPILRE